MNASLPTYRYRIDASDRIVWVCPLWLAFAQENGAPQLVEGEVLDRSLWEFVTGDPTRSQYAEAHAAVRRSGSPCVIPFRCDSPRLQREMRLTIAREAAGSLLYESVLLRVEPQRSLGLFDSTRPRSNSFLTICSCCTRALLEPVGWLEAEDVSDRLQLFQRKQVPDRRYTICPECERTFKSSLC